MTEPGGEHPEPVLFTTARNPFEARLIAAILRDADIPVFIEGELLTDEFAMSQRLLNLQGVGLMVPENRVEEATQALAAAREAGKLLEAEAGEAEAQGGAAAGGGAGDPEPRA
jgi:hypothetical protein